MNCVTGRAWQKIRKPQGDLFPVEINPRDARDIRVESDQAILRALRKRRVEAVRLAARETAR